MEGGKRRGKCNYSIVSKVLKIIFKIKKKMARDFIQGGGHGDAMARRSLGLCFAMEREGRVDLTLSPK